MNIFGQSSSPTSPDTGGASPQDDWLTQQHHGKKISAEFNRISQQEHGTDGILFHELSPDIQTLMISIGYQYGSKGAPKFFGHVAKEDWQAAQAEMESENWDTSNKGKQDRQNRRRQALKEIMENEKF